MKTPLEEYETQLTKTISLFMAMREKTANWSKKFAPTYLAVIKDHIRKLTKLIKTHNFK